MPARIPALPEAARDLERAAELLSDRGRFSAPEALISSLREEAAYLRDGDLSLLGRLPGAQWRYMRGSRLTAAREIVQWAERSPCPLDAEYFAALDGVRGIPAGAVEVSTDLGVEHSPGTDEASREWRYGFQPGGAHTVEPLEGFPWRHSPALALSEAERGAVADALLLYAEGVEENLRDDDPEGPDPFPAVEDLQGQADRVRAGLFGALDADTFEVIEELREVWADDIEHLGPALDRIKEWRAREEEPTQEAPHQGHYSRLGGAYWCDTCNSPYCDLA